MERQRQVADGLVALHPSAEYDLPAAETARTKAAIFKWAHHRQFTVASFRLYYRLLMEGRDKLTCLDYTRQTKRWVRVSEMRTGLHATRCQTYELSHY